MSGRSSFINFALRALICAGGAFLGAAEAGGAESRFGAREPSEQGVAQIIIEVEPGGEMTLGGKVRFKPPRVVNALPDEIVGVLKRKDGVDPDMPIYHAPEGVEYQILVHTAPDFEKYVMPIVPRRRGALTLPPLTVPSEPVIPLRPRR